MQLSGQTYLRHSKRRRQRHHVAKSLNHKGPPSRGRGAERPVLYLEKMILPADRDTDDTDDRVVMTQEEYEQRKQQCNKHVREIARLRSLHNHENSESIDNRQHPTAKRRARCRRSHPCKHKSRRVPRTLHPFPCKTS